MNKESKLFKKIDDTYIEITKEQLIMELQESNKSLEQENERLNNIINELEKYIISMIDNSGVSISNTEIYEDVLDKLKELKGE